MTWREVKVTALQKMFAIAGSDIAADESVTGYLAAMPQAAAEGMALICAAGKGPVATAQVEHRPAEDAPAYVRYDLRSIAPDFYRLRLDGVTCEENGRVVSNPPYGFEGDDMLLLPKRRPGVYRVQYHVLPPTFSTVMPDEYEVPLAPEVAVLLPLYMASQLYKDDDLMLSTVYRNEFEVALENAKVPQAASVCEEFVCESGWI